MKKKSNIFQSPFFPLILSLALYIAGVFCMNVPDIDPLRQAGIATQDEYTYTDSEGEEHEGESLVEITGIGKILTYKDIYFAPVPLFLLVLLVGLIVFNHSNTSKRIDPRLFVLAYCVLGALLIWLTSKETIISTVLYWLAVIALWDFSIKIKDEES